MSLIEKVLNDPFFKSFADKVDESEKKMLEESVREMLSSADHIYAVISDAVSTEDSREELLDAIEHVISPEGLKEWLETN